MKQAQGFSDSEITLGESTPNTDGTPSTNEPINGTAEAPPLPPPRGPFLPRVRTCPNLIKSDGTQDTTLSGKVGWGTEAKVAAALRASEVRRVLLSGDEAQCFDSFGIPAYAPAYPARSGGCTKGSSDSGRGSGYLSVPWSLRMTQQSNPVLFFDFIRQRQFWKQIEFAFRITAISVLVPAAIIAADLPNSPFVSAFMAISATVLAAKGTVGEAIAYLFGWIRAGCLWLPLSVIGGALHLGDHLAWWCIYYTLMLFFMATFTEAMPRRICLLLFNSCMVGLLINPTRGPVWACRVMVDWLIGTGLCTAAAFLPYPLFCKRKSQSLLCDIAKNTGTIFRGMVYSFWCSSNVERSMAMSKVRVMTDSLDSLLPAFEHQQAFSFFEFFFESGEVREIRNLKFAFFERLRVNISSMNRVLDIVEDSPNAIDDSDRSQAFRELLSPHLNAVAESLDELMDRLSTANTKQNILALHTHFDSFRQCVDELQDAYLLSRRMLFYEYTSSVIEEFVPLMTFYLFTVICFRDSIDIFETDAKKFNLCTRDIVQSIFKKVAWEPFMDNVEFLRKMCTTWKRHEVQRIVEAAKVSGAMILTIGFSYLIGVDKNSFSGPNIIAFTSGMNPVEALQASIVRLTGCLIGTVLGFFAGTFSTTSVQRVASLCTLIFIGTFLRNDKEYGIMSVYAMFVLIPLDSILPTTMEDTVQRMNQNTFGIFIYLLVSILIMPLSPSIILPAKRVNVLRRMCDAMNGLCDLFSTPLVTELNLREINNSEDDNHLSLDDDLRVGVSNRSMYMISRKDVALEEINAILKDIIRRLKGTKEMMGFAKDERGLVTIDYPVKACNSTYTHMYRMTFLLKTMWMSWNVIRSQKHYTPETRRMLHNLQPVAHDLSSSFSRIVELLTYMMGDPSVNLEVDIMKSVLDLIATCKEVHTRKSKLMLMIINSSVKQYREMYDRNSVALSNPTTAQSHQGEPIFPQVPAKLRRAASKVSTGVPETQVYPTNFRMVHSERNVSVLPFLRRDNSINEVSVESPVHLPIDFEFPVTSEDAEGLHSFTLCLEMFSNETKLLVMCLTVMIDHLRSKM